jgi:CDP-ribitol ribitolphosphotransferase
VLCIVTHDDGEGSNVSLTVKALKEQEAGYSFSYITKKDTLEVKGLSSLRSLFAFFLQKPNQLARAQIILMDNIFLPFAYLRIRKGVKVIQLWHGTGTIKKFGQDVNTGKLRSLEEKANRNITHLIVNSEETRKLYAKTFGINENRVFAIGLPKTDEMLIRINRTTADGMNPDKELIYNKYAIPKNSRLILYAPTFRDQELHNPEVLTKLEDLRKGLPEDCYLGLRLHPFIAKNCLGTELPPRVCQLSFESDLTAVLMASDLLITDYSSIVFEYCLTERPMVFFAYDLEEFSDHGRGFYYNYESYVPGPVVFDAEGAATIIRENRFDQGRIKSFIESNFVYRDGNATERLLKIINE